MTIPPFRVRTIRSSEAVPNLREMLKSGGFAYITVGDVTRCLNFNPMLHGPIKRLPWPFSLIQQQGCSIEVTAASDNLMSSEILRRHDYNSRSQHNEAIATFLLGADPEDSVDIHPLN